MLGEPLQSPKSYIIALNNQFLDRPKKKKKTATTANKTKKTTEKTSTKRK